MKKRAWLFRCKNGKGGTMILLEPVGHNEALAECRLSLGDNVIDVF